MDIKNLSQLKKALTPGTLFTVLDHPDENLIGLVREVTIRTGNGVYTCIHNDPNNAWSICNHGKGMFMSFDRANHYIFDGNNIEWYKYPINAPINELIMAFGNIVPAQ